jgi:hypothetical protein
MRSSSATDQNHLNIEETLDVALLPIAIFMPSIIMEITNIAKRSPGHSV